MNSMFQLKLLPKSFRISEDNIFVSTALISSSVHIKPELNKQVLLLDREQAVFLSSTSSVIEY